MEVKSLKDECKGLEDFLVEASILTSLSHPNLVKLIGVSVDQKPVYFITEFMEKGSLSDYLRSRDRSIIQKSHQATFAQDVCSGMAYMEQRDLVHRCVEYCMYCYAPACTYSKYSLVCHHFIRQPFNPPLYHYVNISYLWSYYLIYCGYMESYAVYICQHVLCTY